MVPVIISSINLFQQGLRFEKNQTEDDMDKVRQKYCELASRELLACKLLTQAWGLGKGNGDCPYNPPPCSESKTTITDKSSWEGCTT